MFALGVILLGLSSLVFVVALIAGANDAATLGIGAVDIPLNVTGAFLLGAATVVVFVMGLELFRSGTKKGIQHRKEKKRLTKLEKELAATKAADSTGTSNTSSGTGTSSSTGSGSSGTGTGTGV